MSKCDDFILISVKLITILYFILAIASVGFAVEQPLILGAYRPTVEQSSIPFDHVVRLEPDWSPPTTFEFSNGLVMWMKTISEVYLDSRALEHSVDGDYYFTVEVEKGEVFFQLPVAPPEGSVFMLFTPSAEIEVHSSEFSVDVFGDSKTYVRCYKGTLTFTSTVDFSVFVLSEGEEAVVVGRDGEKNIAVVKYKLSWRAGNEWEKIKGTLSSPLSKWTVVSGKMR